MITAIVRFPLPPAPRLMTRRRSLKVRLRDTERLLGSSVSTTSLARMAQEAGPLGKP